MARSAAVRWASGSNAVSVGMINLPDLKKPKKPHQASCRVQKSIAAKSKRAPSSQLEDLKDVRSPDKG